MVLPQGQLKIINGNVSMVHPSALIDLIYACNNDFLKELLELFLNEEKNIDQDFVKAYVNASEDEELKYNIYRSMHEDYSGFDYALDNEQYKLSFNNLMLAQDQKRESTENCNLALDNLVEEILKTPQGKIYWEELLVAYGLCKHDLALKYIP